MTCDKSVVCEDCDQVLAGIRAPPDTDLDSKFYQDWIEGLLKHHRGVNECPAKSYKIVDGRLSK